MSAYRRGDKAAGERLFAALRRPLAAVCLALSGDRALVEEVVQETSLRVLRALPRFTEGRPVRPWVLQIARNVVWDMLRNRRPSAPLDEVPDPGPAADPEAALIRREDAARLAAAVGDLPAALREAVVLKYSLGLGNDEIAEILDASREAVWTRLSRARKELRRRIHDDL